jgi:hypothetical protein
VARQFLPGNTIYELQNLAGACSYVAVLTLITTAFLQQDGVNLQHTDMLLPSK